MNNFNIRLRISIGVLFGVPVGLYLASLVLFLWHGIDLNAAGPLSIINWVRDIGLGPDPRGLFISISVGLCCMAGFVLIAVFAGPKAYFGNARWAGFFDILRMRLFSAGGVLLGKFGGRYLYNDEPLHTLVAAPTRSGKGVGVVIPNLLSFDGSAIVLDIKNENYDVTSKFRHTTGSKIFRWSPYDDGLLSHRFNFLDAVRRDPNFIVSDLYKIGQILLPEMSGGNAMWQNEARDLFVGLALYVLETEDLEDTIGTIYRILKSKQPLGAICEHVLNERVDLSPACVQSLSNFKNKAVKEQSGVKSNLTSALNLWSSPLVDAATSASDFFISDLRKERTTIYVCVSPDQLNVLRPLLNLFFEFSMAVLTRELPDKAKEPHQVLMLIDEFASLGKMDVVANALSYAAGYNVRIVSILQGIAQLDGIYGTAVRSSMLQNSGLQVFFAANDETTSKYISGLCGQKTIRTQSESYSLFSPKTNFSKSSTGRPLILPEEVRQLDGSKAIIVKEGQPPVKLDKIRYFSDNSFKSRLLGAVKTPPLETRQEQPFELDIGAECLERYGGVSLANHDLPSVFDDIDGESVGVSESQELIAQLAALGMEEVEEGNAEIGASLEEFLKVV